MKLTLLTQVVPTLSAEPGDTHDYPLELARQLREHCDIDSQFILCDPNWNGPAQIAGFAVRRLRFPNEARLWGMLASLKNPGAVMLHYDGYGYDSHGIPAWLYLGMKSWLHDQGTESTSSAKQFFTVFHDLWKTEPKPWRAGFYLQARQKRLVARLHRLSKASLTCGPHRHCQLETLEPGKTIELPISSSLPGPLPATAGGDGEPGQTPAAGRQRHQQNADWKIIAMKYQAVLETKWPLLPLPPRPAGVPILSAASTRQSLTVAGS